MGHDGWVMLKSSKRNEKENFLRKACEPKKFVHYLIIECVDSVMKAMTTRVNKFLKKRKCVV